MSNSKSNHHAPRIPRAGWWRGTLARTLLCSSIMALALAVLPSVAQATCGPYAPFIGSPSATPSHTSAKVNININTYCYATNYTIEYGPSSSYGSSVSGVTGARENEMVEETISGLTENTEYHYKITASSTYGSATPTSDHTFRTMGNATKPAVTVNAASSITGGEELSGTINPNGSSITSYHFEYSAEGSGVYESVAGEQPDPQGSTAVTVSVKLKIPEKLLPNTTYNVRLFAENAGGPETNVGPSFTTPKGEKESAPAAIASPAIEITQTSAKLKGEINPDGLKTTYHFELGKSIAYGTNLPEPEGELAAGETTKSIEVDISGLEPNTTYHYRVFAKNSKGKTESVDREITTLPVPPAVVATPFTKTAGGYVINGTVNPQGAETSYHFEFGTTTAYGTNLPSPEAVAGSGNAPVAVSVVVGEFPPAIPYHYRLVAKNKGGTTISEDQEFTTPAEEPVTLPVLPPTLPPPSNQFTVGTAVAKGTTASLSVSVPGPGTISVSGNDLKSVTSTFTGAGSIDLKLKLTSAGAKALKKAKGHKLKLKVTITFQPTGGSPATTSKSLMFKSSGRKLRRRR